MKATGFFVTCSIFLLLFGCQSAPAKKPRPKQPSATELLMKQNQELGKMNRELAQRLSEIEKARKKDRLEHEKRLRSMDTTISMMEQNVSQMQGRIAKAQKNKARLEKASKKEQASPTGQPAPATQATPAASAVAAPGSPQAASKSTATGPSPQKATQGPSRASARTKQKGLIPRKMKPSSRASLIPIAVGPAATPSKPLKKQPIVAEKEYFDPDLNPPISPILLQPTSGAKRSYNQGYKYLSQGKYELSIEQWENFLHRYPNDLDADNAQYWLGMAYFEMKALEGAEESFRKTLTNYKHGTTQMGHKTPDSILMLGRIYKKKLRPHRAKYYFKQVIHRYPHSRSAAKAKKELSNLQRPKS